MRSQPLIVVELEGGSQIALELGTAALSELAAALNLLLVPKGLAQ